MQQLVRRRVAGRALVEIVDLVVLGRLARGQQPVDGSDPRLEAQPQRQADARGIGTLDSELLHPLLEAPAMAALRLGHAPEDVGLAIGHPARDQVVHAAGDDLAFPSLQQAFADLCGASAMPRSVPRRSRKTLRRRRKPAHWPLGFGAVRWSR